LDAAQALTRVVFLSGNAGMMSCFRRIVTLNACMHNKWWVRMEMGYCVVKDWWETLDLFMAFSDLVASYRICEANCSFLLVSWLTISLYTQYGNLGVLLYLDVLGLYSGFGWLAVGRIFGLGARFGVYEILTAFYKGKSFCFLWILLCD